jgi:cysteine desulfurase
MIYADYNGSTPLLPEVSQYLDKRLHSHLFANPNAIHSMGQKINMGIEKCRELISGVVGCHPDQLIFTSGSSEGISTVFHSILNLKDQKKKKIILSPIEHSAVLNTALYYKEEWNYELIYTPVDADGLVDIIKTEELIAKNQSELAMICVMSANNETGVIQPFEKIATIAQKFNIPFFSDTTQTIGKHEFNFEKSGIDYGVLSSHKLGALVGAGFIVAKNPVTIKPLIFGGGQEKGLRGGTQNYIAIETMAIALNVFNEQKGQLIHLKSAREEFEAQIKALCPEVVIFGEKTPRLAGTTLLSFPGIHGQAVQIELESHDIFATTSAACSDNQPETSKVLKSMDVPDDIGRGVIRLSLSFSQGQKEYSALAHALKSAYTKLGKIQSY